MSKDEQRKVIEVIVRIVLELPEDVVLEADLVNQGLDSISAIALIVELEEHFSLEFKENDLSYEKVRTVDLILKLIQNQFQQTTE